MIEVLQLGRSSGHVRLREAIEQALALGTHDAAAVRYLLSARQLEQQETGHTPLPESFHSAMSGSAAPHFERPLPDVDNYDLLLSDSRSNACVEVSP